MAQSGYTPISLYFSTTAAAVPTNTNLVDGELAINITDGKLYYKDNTGTVQLLVEKGASGPAGSDGQIQYNSSGAFGALAYGNAGEVLTSQGDGLDPIWEPASGGITTGKSIAMAMIFGF